MFYQETFVASYKVPKNTLCRFVFKMEFEIYPSVDRSTI